MNKLNPIPPALLIGVLLFGSVSWLIDKAHGF